MGAAPARGMAAGFFVSVVTPKGNATKRVEGDLLTVGRAEDCHLSIAHDTLSRRHLSVSLRNDECWVEDHGSANGTFINGKRIKPHSPVRVQPDDQIALGQSGVRISVSPEPMIRKESLPPVPGTDENSQVSDTIISSTTQSRRAQRHSVVGFEPKVPDVAHTEAEKLIQDALKRAATLIQEAEVEAERRVEDIYRRAHELQAKADEIYQKRMNEAFRTAEQTLQKAQAESQGILLAARHKSSEIRAQAEGFVMDLRRRTEEECERLLEEAQTTARELKEARLAEAEDMIKKKEEELLEQARHSMNERMARFEEGLSQEADSHRAALEVELRDQKALLEKLRSEVEALVISRDHEDARLKDLSQDVQKHLSQVRDLKEESENAKKQVVDFNQELCNLRTEIDVTEKQRFDAARRFKETEEQVARINEEHRSLLERLKAAQADFDSQLAKVRTTFEEDRANIQKKEEEHLEQLKLETTRKVQTLEQELLEELHLKRERLGRELALKVEAYLKENASGGPDSFRSLQDEINKWLGEQIVSLSKDPTAEAKKQSLVSLKRKEKWRAALIGLAIGAVSVYGGQRVHRHLRSNLSPMQKRVADAQEERRQDLERRKFAPTQDRELRSTYMDSVIYTQKFVEIYTDENFQKKFLKAVGPYLLKTWRVQEDKVIELLAVTQALVKALDERKQAIHPDFVNQGLEKMKDLEAEAQNKMRQILGTQVRVESFKKFERQFFEDWLKTLEPQDT